MRFFVILFAVAGVACGAPGKDPSDPGKIEVPPQPPPVVAVSPSSDGGPAREPSTPKPVVPFVCAPPAQRFDLQERSYCAYSDPRSWTDAESRCVSNGGHLMSLRNRSESTIVRLSLGNPVEVFSRAAWIGLEAVNKSKKQWKWATGEKVEAGRWNEGEPNDWDGHESCGELLTANGRWNDTRCDLEQAFVCQRVAGKKFDPTNTRPLVTPPDKYWFVQEARTYTQAKKACAQRGGAIAVLTTPETLEEVDRSIVQRFRVPRFWIGLNDLAEQGIWSWVADNQGLGGDGEWQAGEPNNFGREGCVEVHTTDTWRWNDLDCSVELPSVCESPRERR